MGKINSRDIAYNSIHSMILSQKIAPGESVTEHALSQQLGIGRTPVREALAKLQAEGLIESEKGRKTVHSLTLDEIDEIFDIKIALESAMAGWAATRGSKVLKKKLAAIMIKMKNLAEYRPKDEVERKQYLQSWLKTDAALHQFIFKMADSEKAQNIIENMNQQWHRTRISVYALEGRVLRSAKEHETFVKHIISGDAQKAETAMKSHLQKLKQEIHPIFELFNL